MYSFEALLRRCPDTCLHLRLCLDFCLHRKRVGKGYAFVNSYCWQGCTRNEKAKAFSYVTSLDGGLCYDSASLSSKQVSQLLCVSDDPGSNEPWPNPMILGELVF